jgi:hypothetical protein
MTIFTPIKNPNSFKNATVTLKLFYNYLNKHTSFEFIFENLIILNFYLKNAFVVIYMKFKLGVFIFSCKMGRVEFFLYFFLKNRVGWNFF